MPDIINLIKSLYSDNYEEVYSKITDMFPAETKKQNKTFLSEKDIVLIVYPDHVYERNNKTLSTLNDFIVKYLKGSISCVHILPFFPYSSDDGFSIIDYTEVNSEFGTWNDIKKISENFELMIDLVINHISSEHEWFREFLKGNKENYFLHFDGMPNASKIFRPRTTPLFTKFPTKNGDKYVWTTFSEDQVDLNFSNPEVLIEILKILKQYIDAGARIIRLDAIAYIWKDLKKKSISEPEVHKIVSIMRLFAEKINHDLLIITETNVDHEQNISYFGDGSNEAHTVYNFTLSPLLLYSFMTENSEKLSLWVESLTFPSNETTFFNFTASHDGIGVLPLKGICSENEIDSLIDFCKKRGALINYRKNEENENEPYEINSVYRDLFFSDEAFLASQCIMLSLKGLPAIYFNSIIDVNNYYAGIEKTGNNRTINREKFEKSWLSSHIENSSLSQRYIHMAEVRRNESSFSPLKSQQVFNINKSVLCILRDNSLLVLVNLSNKAITLGNEPCRILNKETVKDILEENEHKEISLSPYQYLWLK